MPRNGKSSYDKQQTRHDRFRDGADDRRGGGKNGLSRRPRFNGSDWEDYEGNWKPGASRRRQSAFG